VEEAKITSFSFVGRFLLPDRSINRYVVFRSLLPMDHKWTGLPYATRSLFP